MSEIQIAGTWCPTIIVFLTVQDQGPEGSSPDFGGGVVSGIQLRASPCPQMLSDVVKHLKHLAMSQNGDPKATTKVS